MSIDAELVEMRARLQEQAATKDDPHLGRHYKMTKGRIDALERRKKEQQKIQTENADLRSKLISADAQRGVDFAKDTLGLGEGTLGRATKTVNVDESRFQDLSQGLSAEELQGNRDKAKEEINRSTQLQNRRLQALQAQQGIRGGTAGAQQLSIMQQGEDRKANFERDLFLQDRNARMEGLANLTQVQMANQQAAREQERFNLQQAAQEKYDLAKAGMTFADMGVTERGAEKARQAQVASAEASAPRCFEPRARVVLKNGETKEIQYLKAGEELMGGGKVLRVMKYACAEPIYMVDGVKITGMHAIKDGDTWIRVKNGGYKKAGFEPYVYNLVTEKHRVLIDTDITILECADYDETDLGDLISDDESLIMLRGAA